MPNARRSPVRGRLGNAGRVAENRRPVNGPEVKGRLSGNPAAPVDTKDKKPSAAVDWKPGIQPPPQSPTNSGSKLLPVAVNGTRQSPTMPPIPKTKKSDAVGGGASQPQKTFGKLDRSSLAEGAITAVMAARATFGNPTDFGSTPVGIGGRLQGVPSSTASYMEPNFPMAGVGHGSPGQNYQSPQSEFSPNAPLPHYSVSTH